MNLEFTKAAVGDLKSIRQYTLETWGGEQEEVYLNDLWKKFEDILDDPSRWRFGTTCSPVARSHHRGGMSSYFVSRERRFKSSASSTAQWIFRAN